LYSQYTPLVEPCANEAVYLDLSGCGDTFAILQRIGYFVLHNQQGSLRTGLTTSRLLARIAAGQGLASCSTSTYQVTSYPGIRIIEVLSGHEKEFISVMPLAG